MDSDQGSIAPLRRDENLYAYMFKSGEKRFLYIRKFGSGVESVAQLVEDIDEKKVAIRKVTASRLIQDGPTDEFLKEPREIRILNAIRDTFKPAEPGFPFYITEHMGHEYIKSKDTDDHGRAKYHSVSYWKLCNGSSIRGRWLSGDTIPPVLAVAKMIRQVFSTLHHLYTAGEQPLYHQDVHFGNIWAHWKVDELLPDFYLGDFGDASFADSKHFMGQTEQNKVLVGRQVNDLHKFWNSLSLLVDMLGERKGHGDTRVKALRRLSDGIADVVVRGRDLDDSAPPPDLKPLIAWARDLEELFGEGGDADETQTDAYIRYITAERSASLRVEQEHGRVVRATKEEALRPSRQEGFWIEPELVSIHGPWSLVMTDWVPAEEEGVTHHRPNRGRDGAFADKDLSHTRKQVGQTSLGFFGYESPPNGELILGSQASYSSEVGSDPRLEGAQKQQQEDEEEGSSPTNSWSPGDDAEIAVAPRPEYSWAPGDSELFQVKERQHESSGDDSDHDEYFEASGSCCGDLEPKGSDHEDSELLNDRYGAQRVALIRPGNPTTRKFTVETYEELHLPGIAPGWHELFHGEECPCPTSFWMRDIERILRTERARRKAMNWREFWNNFDVRDPLGCGREV